MEPFIAHRPAWRTLLLIAISLGFVALGLWLAGIIGDTDFNDDPGGKLAGLAALTGAPPSTVAAVIGWSAALLFGLFGLLGSKHLFQRGPVLRLDRQGIWNRAWSDTVIPWDQVRDPQLIAIQRQRFVSFDLADRSLHPPTTMVGRLAALNSKLGYGYISLSVTGTDRRFDEMAAAFFTFYDQASAPDR